MQHETFFHTLPGGENVKFTIFDIIIKHQRYFYAKVINIDLPVYMEESAEEQAIHFGIEVTDGNQNTVYYSDPNALKADLKSQYGVKWLKSEV